jgi:hypothetical protein
MKVVPRAQQPSAVPPLAELDRRVDPELDDDSRLDRRVLDVVAATWPASSAVAGRRRRAPAMDMTGRADQLLMRPTRSIGHRDSQHVHAELVAARPGVTGPRVDHPPEPAALAIDCAPWPGPPT